MTPKKLFVAAVSAAMFFSCANNKDGGSGEGGDKTAKVFFEVSLEDASTRATFPSPIATTEEKTITNVGLFIFNNQKMLETYLTKDYIRETGGTFNRVNFEFELPVGRHYAFAVANVPKGYLSYAVEGMTIDKFSEEIFNYELEVLTGKDFFAANDLDGKLAAESRGFFMTLENGTEEFFVVDLDELSDASANKVVLDLGRAVAKVAVAFEPGTQQNGTLSNVEYIVDNNPSRMYVVPQYKGSALITPNYDLSYVDPNKFQDPLDDYIKAIDEPAGISGTYTYCMENSNYVPREGNATMVMVKGLFTPAQLSNKDGTDYSGTPLTKTFWMIATVVKGKRYYESGQYFVEKPDDNLLNEPGKVLEAVEFPDGICYYPVWLRNKDSENENQYTVKRNSYYRLTINSVSGAGYPDPDEAVDPETPLDKEVKIGITVTVANWNEIDDEQGI